MKKTIIALLTVLTIGVIMLSLVACDLDGKDKTAWLDSLKKASESSSAMVTRTIKEGDILLSESVGAYSKTESGWSVVQNDKTLNNDPFATEKYTTTTSEKSAQSAPIFSIDKDIIEDFTIEISDNVTKYDVFIYADKLKGFLSLTDADYSRISDFDLEIEVIGDKVSDVVMGYKIDGSQVSLKIHYAY